MIEVKNKLFQYPWRYKESFLIFGLIFFISFTIDAFTGYQQVRFPSYPVNLILLILFFAILIILFIFRKYSIIQWFSSAYAAIAAMSYYLLLIILIGLIPQNSDIEINFIKILNLNKITHSYPFLTLSVLLLLMLGNNILIKIQKPFNAKNLKFIINHGGIFLIILAVLFGSSDIVRLQMPLEIKKKSNIAFIDHKHYIELPFFVALDTFIIEEYSPELVFINKKNNKIIFQKKTPLPKIQTNNKGSYLGFNYEIIEYLPFAYRIDNEFYSMHHFGATHAAKIRINENEGWISCGNFMFNPVYLDLNDSISVGMLEPKIKKYVSKIIFSRSNKSKYYSIEVNKPFKDGQWAIYQAGYDRKLGRWSKISILSIVRDPWLPLVYIGFIMMLLGTLNLLLTITKEKLVK